jgi:hypothetical protein
MRRRCLLFATVPLILAGTAGGQVANDPLPDVPETVYDTPPLRQPGAGFNDGAVGLDFAVLYSTDYVFRGIEIVEPPGGEDAINIGLDVRIAADLGRLPDPFVQVVTNTAEGDDLSNFQVIRPIAGLQWETAAFDLTLAHQSFTYPDRDPLDTSEIFVEIHFVDGLLFGEDRRILGPFVKAVYDYDALDGFYFSAGFRRELSGDEGFAGLSNLTFGWSAHVAYVEDYGGPWADPGLVGDARGFHHYQVGLFATYELNTLLNISRRYGRWSLEGFVNYTDGIDNDLRADTQIWGGGGVVLRY